MSDAKVELLDTSPSERRYQMPFTRIELVAMSVDEGRLVVLLGKRAQAPHKGKWALPGGALRIDLDRDLEAAAQRVAVERLGVELPFLRQLKAAGGATRDSRAPWAMSIAYRALVPFTAIAPSAGKRLDAIEWRSADYAMANTNLAFDHAELIKSAVETTRHEIEQLDLPYDFLPENFTLGELQGTCEAILGKRLDKSSFRRRLDDKKLLKAVPGNLRTGSFRPAQLFRRR